MVSRATRNPPRRCRRNQYFVDVDIFRVILKLSRDQGHSISVVRTCVREMVLAGWSGRSIYPDLLMVMLAVEAVVRQRI